MLKRIRSWRGSGALGRREAVEEFADASPDGFDGSLGGFAQARFQLGEDLFDRIEVGAVGRQEDQVCARLSDGPAGLCPCGCRGCP